MNDRISTYPGRVKLTDAETFDEKYYYLQMADEPTEPGTPLDKAHLLTDATVAQILEVCGTSPTDVNTALSIINSKLVRVKTGTYTGSCAQTQDYPYTQGGPMPTPSVTQSISNIGFKPMIVILSNVGGSSPVHLYVPGYGYTAVLVRDETSYDILRPYPSSSWYDDDLHKQDGTTAEVRQEGIDSISWGNDSISWTGWHFRTEVWDESGYHVIGYRFTLCDNFNLSGHTYRYTIFGF